MTEQAQFHLLGAVEATVASRPVDLGPPRQRAVLAVLLMEAGQVVTMDRLIQRVWDGGQSSQPRKVLYSYVSRLRGALSGADTAIRWNAGGYLLDADPDTIDVHRFERLLHLGRSTGDAAGQLRAALALWRGEPFAGLDVPWLRQEAERLAGLRDSALADLRDLRLRLGEHAELIPELRAALTRRPLDERLAGQLMLALYRTGRQAEALDCYESLRELLAESLGSDPGPETQLLHHQIRTGDEALARPERPQTGTAAGDQAPATLPWDASHFTGRDAELAQLDALAGAEPQPGTVSAVVVSGGGGAGKTALAVHWAHQPAVRSAFPHGRLYLNLQGFSDHPPLTAADALRGLLGQLGVPGTEIPSDPGQAQRLYHRRLDGRRVLVILDSAIDAGQVRPLLAGPPGLSLVTSRNRLTGLAVQEGAAQIQLGRLPDGDAQVLAGRLLGEHHPPGLTSRLSEICANLPLAIRLAAAGYRAAHPDTRLGDYLQQLAADRIGLLDAGADSATAITGVLSRSVERLPPELVRAFQLAGLHPGPRADAPAIAALLEVTERQCRRVVRELAGASLLEETSPGRWSMHDLLAEYARHRTGPEADAAYARLLEHYTVRLATEPIDHRWINSERGALLACLRLPAAPDGIERYALRLGDRFFEVDLFADSRHAYEVLRERCPADSHTYALATFGIGRAEVWLDGAAAEPILNEALAHFQRLGDPRGQARTLRQLAEWNRGRGLHQEAMDLQALELFRSAGDLEGESDTLIGLALEATSCGDYPRAREQATRALQLALQTGSARRRGESHRVLGHVASLTGEPAVATDHYTQALSLFTSVGVQRGRGLVLMNLGDAAMAAGEYQRAVEYQRQALAIFTEVSHRNDQAHAYLRLGKTALAMDDPARAREHFSRALETNRELGNRAGIAFNLLGLAHVLLATGAQAEAAEQYRQVAADLAELGYPRGEAEARLGLGRALAAMGDHRGARERMGSALELFEKIGSPQAAEAREGLRQLPAPPS